MLVFWVAHARTCHNTQLTTIALTILCAPSSSISSSCPQALAMAVPQSFPAKIYQILENESPDIISWNDNGISFRIVDHGRFEREIVPKYFRRKQS